MRQGELLEQLPSGSGDPDGLPSILLGGHRVVLFGCLHGDVDIDLLETFNETSEGCWPLRPPRMSPF